MLFCTTQFLYFFLLVFVLYWALPWQRARVVLLLAASFYFYATWNRWLASLILFTTVLDYLVGLGMEATAVPWRRRLLLTLSIVANLGMLCYFKYANFFLRSVEEALRAAGQEASLPVLSVILPIGISFYTFEAINYTVDVYRGKVAAERNLFHFILFILFFPHLVAGPIVRARDFLPQIRRPKRWDWARLNLGAQYVLIGLFKKLAIADRMALFADPIFAEPGAFSTATLWMGAVAYALQVYCDFSGYTDIALGCAHLLGYKLAQNFNMPYLSANISEFWRRWHISLSSWIRDYLFIPLGGSRGGRWRTYGNLVLTMTLAGLWHGAAWTYVVFGFVQGLMLSGHRTFREWCERRPTWTRALNSLPGTILRVAFTFTCFCYSLVIFRAHSLADAGVMLGRMAWPSGGQGSPLPAVVLAVTLLFIALGHVFGQRALWRRLADRTPLPLRGLAFGIVLTLALALAPDASKAFVYFQF